LIDIEKEASEEEDGKVVTDDEFIWIYKKHFICRL